MDVFWIVQKLLTLLNIARFPEAARRQSSSNSCQTPDLYLQEANCKCQMEGQPIRGVLHQEWCKARSSYFADLLQFLYG